MKTMFKTCFRCGVSSGTKSVPSHWTRMSANTRNILCSRCRYSQDPAVGWQAWEAQVLVEGQNAGKPEREANEQKAIEGASALQEASDQWHRNVVKAIMSGQKVF